MDLTDSLQNIHAEEEEGLTLVKTLFQDLPVMIIAVCDRQYGEIIPRIPRILLNSIISKHLFYEVKSLTLIVSKSTQTLLPVKIKT